MNDDVIDLEQTATEFLAFRQRFKTVQLATADAEGKPEASYAPFIREGKDFYVYVSELSKHTANMLANPEVSLIFLEPEDEARQLFARRRLTYYAVAEDIPRDSENFTALIDAFQMQFGSIMDILKSLADFHLLKLVPHSGNYVAGFGKAFELAGKGLDQVQHINPAADAE